MDLTLIAGAAVGALLVSGLMIAVMLRRIVPTNMVHIVQTTHKSTPYGRNKPAGNCYYAWPSWVPRLGVTVTEFPESNFQVTLAGYDAYDVARLPFVVDVTAFFRISDAETAAQRVATFETLKADLFAVLQGAVRRILATNPLEDIMQARGDLGAQFTAEVEEQVKEWGAVPVKTIEFMDLRDARDSQVIADIMAKEKSRIDKESRIVVASNNQEAMTREIDAERTIEVRRQDAEQQVGLRTAEKDKTVGIANEQASQEVQEQARITAAKTMDVEAVKRERDAEITRNVRVTEATAAKESTILNAEAQLAETLKDAEGIAAKGAAEAQAQELMLMAPVTAQIKLAEEIGQNAGYQTYLVTLEQVKAGQVVGLEMAQALAKADLKVISTGGGEGVLPGVARLGDLFSPEGGTKLAGMLAGLAGTAEGGQTLGALLSRLTRPSPAAGTTSAEAPSLTAAPELS